MLFEFTRDIHCDTPKGETQGFKAGQKVDDKDMLPGVLEVLKRHGTVVPVATPAQPKK